MKVPLLNDVVISLPNDKHNIATEICKIVFKTHKTKEAKQKRNYKFKFVKSNIINIYNNLDNILLLKFYIEIY